ncbi:tetratricopeptide repeat protein [uncultured Akkermansia sp.]|uniref:tetratricopeptide repeat protein n=1 Tax=uncultured Akkermansia sp. TaxID=512294 RepID=UPI00265CE7F9|nr:tetratricopeptide repeat protein [uncultured Akkermansia sp.]
MMTPLPLGITLALSLTCGALPLLAQVTYVPGPMPVSPGASQDPTDMYLEALKLVTQAAGLVEKHDYIGAIRLTQQAEDKFGRLVKAYPQWRPNLLQTRRQLNRENLDKWQKLAQQQAVAPSGPGLELERPAVVQRPRPKPNIALPPGYKGVEFPSRPGEPLVNAIPSPSVSPGAAPEVVESNYERIRRLLDKTTMENKALVQALKRTRKEQEDILAKLAVASAGESVYRDELLKVKKQMEEERSTSNKLLQTLTRRVEELEQNVATLRQEKAQYLAQIADLQLQLKEHREQLAKVTDEKNALQKDRDQLAALVELNSPDKTKNLLDRNLTLAAQLKDAQDKISALETANSNSEEQRKANLKALEEARNESADLKQKLIAIRDENIGYRKRITELNTKLINADVELSKLEANPEKSPLLVEENQLLRSTIAKQLRILSVQDQSRSLLISTYKRLHQQNPETAEIAALMDNEEAIKLTPAEKQIVNAIASDNKIDVPLTDQQKEKINKLAMALSAERDKAAQLAKDLELARSQTQAKTAKSAKNDKEHANALAQAQKALEQKNLQVEELSRQMDELKTRFAEQARLAAISTGSITPDQEKMLNRSLEATVRRKLETEALGQGAAEAFAKKRYAAAEQLYRTLLDLQPSHVPALVNLGTILLQRNKADEAIEYLKKATKLDAASSPAWFMMGVAQYRAGQDQQAIASLTETIRLDPANAPALLYLGNLETSAGNYEQAVGHFENALKIQPESPDAHFNLAWTYSRLGRTAQARKSYDAAIRCGGLPDSDLELAINGTTTLPRRKQEAEKAATPSASGDGMRLAAAVSDPAAIPHDAYEVPAHVAEDPNAVEKPSPGPKQIVVNHRPESEPVSLASQVRETASVAAPAPGKPETTAAAVEQPKPEKQEAPRRRGRFRIGS